MSAQDLNRTEIELLIQNKSAELNPFNEQAEGYNHCETVGNETTATSHADDSDGMSSEPSGT